MQQGIQRMGPSTGRLLSVTAMALTISSVGLILPAVSNRVAWMAPISAALLAVMLLISIWLHRKCREKPLLIVSLILVVMSIFTAYGRWVGW